MKAALGLKPRLDVDDGLLERHSSPKADRGRVVLRVAAASQDSVQPQSPPPQRLFRHSRLDDGLPSGVIFGLAQCEHQTSEIDFVRASHGMSRLPSEFRVKDESRSDSSCSLRTEVPMRSANKPIVVAILSALLFAACATAQGEIGRAHV